MRGFAAPIGRDYVETPYWRHGVEATNALVAHTLYVGRVYPDRDQTLTKLMWLNGGTVTGNVEAVVLTFDGTNWNRVGTTGAVAQAGTTAVQVVTGLSIPVYRALPTYLGLIPRAAGHYGRTIAVHADMNGISGSGLLAGLVAAVADPCPTSVSGIAVDTRAVWIAGAA